LQGVKIHLKDQLVYKWAKHPQLEFYLKGNVCHKNKLLSVLDLATMINQNLSSASLNNVLENLTGHFAFVFYDDEKLLMVNDCVSSFPVFYFLENDLLQIRDRIQFDTKNESYPGRQIDQFISSCFTLNDDLLFSDFKRLPNGSILLFENKKLFLDTYLNKHKNIQAQTHSLPQLEKKYEETLADVFGRIYEQNKNNQILIPLSGGLDSRLILAKMIEAGHQNIKCFTYGQENSFEREIAEKICKKLGVDWQFISFDKQVFEKYFSAEYQAYSNYAFNGSSLPYEQDFLALLAYKNRVGWEENSIVLSGFGADVLAGSWLPSDIAWSKIDLSINGLIEYILQNKKFFLSESLELNKKELHKKIATYFKEIKINNKQDFLHALNHWGFDHRVSKYQIGCMRAFEKLGLRWTLPFCDKKYFDFWMNEVALEKKRDKLFYKNFIDKEIFKPLDIDFYYQGILHQKPNDGIITKLKNLTPKPIKAGIKAFIPRKKLDVNNFDLLCDMLWEKLDENSRRRFKKDRYNLNVLEGKVFVGATFAVAKNSRKDHFNE